MPPTTERLAGCAGSGELAVRVGLQEEAWPLFEAGDIEAFHAAIEAAVRELAQPEDVAVLAQASMAPVADRLDEFVCPVPASPRLAIREAARRLLDRPDRAARLRG